MHDFSILQKAIISDNIEIITNVLRSIENVNAIGGSGIGVLHYYISESKQLSLDENEVMRLFYSIGLNINLQNSKGISPLHYLTYHPNYKIAKSLIANGAIIDITDEMGNTPLWRAVMNFRGNTELLNIIKLLIESGANPDKPNNSGNSPRKIVLDRHRDLPIIGSPKEWDLQPHLNW